MLRLRDPRWADRKLATADELVVEWRALTVAHVDAAGGEVHQHISTPGQRGGHAAAYEVLRDTATHKIEICTPLEATTGSVFAKKLVFVSILRAGTGILDGMRTVVPGARVGHIGLYLDPKT